MTKTELAIAFCDAVHRGNLAAAKKLLAAGADPNKCPDGWTGAPIVLAVNAGNEAMAKWLLSLNVKRPKELLRAAAYANGIYPPKPFDWLVRDLIERGADVNYLDSGMAPMHVLLDPALLELAFAHGGKVGIEDSDGATPLHWAARSGAIATIEVLLAHGADLNAKDRKNKTPAAYAKAAGSYNKDTVKFLAERGAAVKLPAARTWQQVEDELVKRTVKALAQFAKRHAAEKFSRFALDCNAAYGEVLPSLLPADGKQLWTIGDWKYQEIAAIELDLEGLESEDSEPFMTMACRALVRIERDPAFKALGKNIETLAIDHDEGEAAAKKRWKRVRDAKASKRRASPRRAAKRRS